MKEQIRSEYRKLRTTRSVWGLLAGLVALSGLATWGILASTEPRGLGGAHVAAGVRAAR